jgi:hypothetical protein
VFLSQKMAIFMTTAVKTSNLAGSDDCIRSFTSPYFQVFVQLLLHDVGCPVIIAGSS